MGKQNGKCPNALKHGAFAKTAILPGEDPREFEELHAALIEEWAPVGPTEQDAVLSIANGMWRKCRLQKFLDAKIERGLLTRADPLYDECYLLERLLSLADTPIPKLSEGVVDAWLSDCSPEVAEHLREKYPRQNFESAAEWVRKVRDEITSVILPLLRELGQRPAAAKILASYETVLTPDAFEQELAANERIDAMIDRAIKRLIQTKAMKQMLPHSSPRGDDHPPKIQNGQSNGSARAVAHKNRPGE